MKKKTYKIAVMTKLKLLYLIDVHECPPRALTLFFVFTEHIWSIGPLQIQTMSFITKKLWNYTLEEVYTLSVRIYFKVN